jgi:glycosyltransferase involved in cell wall biosynthesis
VGNASSGLAAAGMNDQPQVAWVLPDKMGGVVTIVANLLRRWQNEGATHHVVLTHNTLQTEPRSQIAMRAATQRVFEYQSPIENVHAIVRRLRCALPDDGVLVANDLLELAMASAFDTGHTIVQILHGDFDYYYDLAARHEDVVDVFVAYASGIASKLAERLPARAADIYYLPYGVELPDRLRSADGGALRLLFVGRLSDPQKGIFHLPEIDRALRHGGVDTRWTVVGCGPDEARLRTMWSVPHVRWTGGMAPADVLALYPDHDVIVMPSRREGFPVTLLEAMAAGVVPVVSDLLCGVREVVEPGTTGLLPAIDDVSGFVKAIRIVAQDRSLLDRMSRAARERIAAKFDIRERVGDYERLFARYRELRRARPAGVRIPYGSRLDRPWIPNPAVKAARTLVRRIQGKVGS